MFQVKLTKAQQAIEDKIMANLSPLQRLKMNPMAASIIHKIANGHLPMPKVDLTVVMAKHLSDPSSFSESLESKESSVSSSVTFDADATPKAETKPSAYLEALNKLDQDKKTAKKKTVKSKKKNPAKPETENIGRKPAPVLTKPTAATAVVKKLLSDNRKAEMKEPVQSVLKIVSGTTEKSSNLKTPLTATGSKLPLPTSAVSSKSASRHLRPEAHVDDLASPSKQKRCSTVRRSQSTPPLSPEVSEVELLNQEKTPRKEEPVLRRSKRSLSVDRKKADDEIASPMVRRSRLAEEPARIIVEVAKTEVIVQSDCIGVDEEAIVSKVTEEEIAKDDEDLIITEIEEEDDIAGKENEENESDSGPETPVMEKSPGTTPKATPVIETTESPEIQKTRTRPVKKPTQEATLAGPEVDQEARIKNQANRPESKNNRVVPPVVIPSASALVEAEKATLHHAKAAAGGTTTKTAKTIVKKPFHVPGTSTATKAPARVCTPMKNTVVKKTLQPSTVVKGTSDFTNLPVAPSTASKRLETPQQKPPMPTTGNALPFGSAGAPCKPKMGPTAAKQRGNSPLPMGGKAPIAMGLAGAAALGKIAIPSNDDRVHTNEAAKPKYDNLVSNVMTFMPQSHGMQAASKHTKLGASASASSLMKAASSSTTMGTKTKGFPSTSTSKLQTTKGLTTSHSKLPVPVTGVPKPVPAVHVITSAQPVHAPAVKPQQPLIDENEGPNPFNSTYTKALDNTMAAFDISRFEETYVDYPIDDVRPCGDDDDDDEDDLKPIPKWAQGARLQERIAKQQVLDSRIRQRLDMDEAKVNIEGIDEALINPDRPARIRPRTSSQHWTTPPIMKTKGAHN